MPLSLAPPLLISDLVTSPNGATQRADKSQTALSEKVLVWVCKLDLSGWMGGWGGVRTVGAAPDLLRNEFQSRAQVASDLEGGSQATEWAAYWLLLPAWP